MNVYIDQVHLQDCDIGNYVGYILYLGSPNGAFGTGGVYRKHEFIGVKSRSELHVTRIY